MLQPPAEIRVLAREHGFIETAELQVEFTAQRDRRARVRHVGRIGVLLQTVDLTAAPLRIRGVELVRIGPEGDGTVFAQAVLDRRQPAIRNFVVGVAERDVLAAGDANADIAGVGSATLVRRIGDPEMRQPRLKAPGDGLARVPGVVVDDNHLPSALTSLPRQRLKLGAEDLGSIPAWHDHADGDRTRRNHDDSATQLSHN